MKLQYLVGVMAGMLARPLAAEPYRWDSEVDVLKAADAAARWQLANPPEAKPNHQYLVTDWTMATLYTGYMAHVEGTGSGEWLQRLREVSGSVDHKLGHSHGFGDDHAIGQLHLWLHMIDEMPKFLAPTEEVMSAFISAPHDEPLEWHNKIHMREWAWCDSLYMSPPTLASLYAATGKAEYLQQLDRLYWKSADYLLDPEESLFYRDSRYFTRKEKNGAKVFWARGNGWVFAGLCHILKHMPQGHETRQRYEELFEKMAKRIVAIQGDDGAWRAALLDPETYPAPESSGTAFFTYGLLWGINHGLLDEKEFGPAAEKGWKLLLSHLGEDGKLGYVQAQGAAPEVVGADDAEVYGTGSFLLAAHEMRKRLLLRGAKSASFSLANPSDRVRLNDVIALDWKKAMASLAGLTGENVAVRDSINGRFLPTQLWDEDRDGTIDQLLVQVNLSPDEKREYQLLALADGKKAPRLENQLQARFVPERKDDFAWENDRMTFRLYGPALAAENATGGIDVWSKKVRYPVIDKWYAKGEKFYHEDHGEGMDAYKVGPSLGLGGTGYLTADGNLVPSPEFATWKVLDKGPLRLRFELTYRPIEVGGGKVAERRVVTMDAGSHFMDVMAHFDVEGDVQGVRPVTGFPFHVAETDSKVGFEEEDAIFKNHWALAVWEQLGDPAKDFGKIGLSILLPEGGLGSESDGQASQVLEKDGHRLIVLARDLGKPQRWQAGGSWQKSDTADRAAFIRLVENHIHDHIARPIVVDQ